MYCNSLRLPCCVVIYVPVLSTTFLSLLRVVVYFEFEQSEYTVSETGNAVILSVIRRNTTDRALTVLFSTRAGTAEGECIFNVLNHAM